MVCDLLASFSADADQAPSQGRIKGKLGEIDGNDGEKVTGGERSTGRAVDPAALARIFHSAFWLSLRTGSGTSFSDTRFDGALGVALPFV
jgi:hypothetical protein